MAKRILVVDDEVDVLEVVRARLAANNYEVITARSGMEALRICSNQTPDLIILDIMMPQLDGLSTLKELRKIPEIKDTPVIMLSVKEKEKMEGLFYFQNITAYIEKPFEPAEFVDKVKQALGETEPRGEQENSSGR